MTSFPGFDTNVERVGAMKMVMDKCEGELQKVKWSQQSHHLWAQRFLFISISNSTTLLSLAPFFSRNPSLNLLLSSEPTHQKPATATTTQFQSWRLLSSLNKQGPHPPFPCPLLLLPRQIYFYVFIYLLLEEDKICLNFELWFIWLSSV